MPKAASHERLMGEQRVRIADLTEALKALMPRAVVLGALATSVCVFASTAAAREIQCGPKPDNPVGYQVRTVGADRVQPPPTTPPIAVLDTGVAEVPELRGRLRPGFDATTGGKNTDDTDGHGTGVATVAAGQAEGVRGISPTSPVIPIKIFGRGGETKPSWVVTAIRKAVSLGARVINISAAGEPGTDRAADRMISEAINDAVSKGVIVVAPSGNEGVGYLDVPATYPHVIAVGGTDESNQPASFSNRGPGLDLVAPGENLYTAAPRSVCPSGYSFVRGTSFSAPAVAGAAALLLQAHPDLDSSQATNMLRLHGSFAPAWTPAFGFGMLDLPAVLAAPVPPADAPEIDDTVAWAKRHPLVLRRYARNATVRAQVAPYSDPSDVFRVALRKGARLKATLSARTLRVSIRSASRTLAKGRGGASAKAPRAGDYYVTVAAPKTPVVGVAYTLTLKRN